VRQTTFAIACFASLVGCGTDAVGVAECRAFESVRCQAAAACGFPNVDECQRFERDHCLHGVALDSVSAIEFDTCTQEIARAGGCAAAQGADTAADACSDAVSTAMPPPTACQVVLSPELASACAFLASGTAVAPAPEPPEETLLDGGS
jgi:hypothetical protein